MIDIQKMLNDTTNAVLTRRMEEADANLKRIFALPGATPENIGLDRCGCETAEIVRDEREATIDPMDRPLYLKPCTGHRHAFNLPERVQIAGPMRQYMPK